MSWNFDEPDFSDRQRIAQEGIERMAERKPAEVFDPREFCREEMDERGLTEAALPWLTRFWLDVDHVDVLMGDEVAAELSDLFGTSMAFWLNLEIVWRSQDPLP